MGKLLKLRNWFTPKDAARYLSAAFQEEECDLDVLRLAVDGELQVSVLSLTSVTCRLLDVVDKADVPTREAAGLNGGTVRLLGKGFFRTSDRHGNELYLKARPEFVEIRPDQVWDVSEWGGGPNFVHNEYSRAVRNPPGSEWVGLDGALLKANNSGSELLMVVEKLDENWIPWDLDPLAFQCVFRRQSLENLIARVAKPATEADSQPVNAKQDGNYLRMIGALLTLLREKPSTAYPDDASIKGALLERLEGQPGFSQRHLDTVFAKANRASQVP